MYKAYYSSNDILFWWEGRQKTFIGWYGFQDVDVFANFTQIENSLSFYAKGTVNYYNILNSSDAMYSYIGIR